MAQVLLFFLYPRSLQLSLKRPIALSFFIAKLFNNEKSNSHHIIFLKNYKNSVDKTIFLYYINIVIENGKCGGIAQLARAIGSYPAGHKFKSYCRYHIWPHRQAVKTSPFHGEVSGSNPLGVTNLNQNRYTILVFLLLKI